MSILEQGCGKLQSLNLAGSVAITERGLGYMVSGAPNLGTLNVTGCQEITVNGLRAAIEGNGYVVEAKSFFGFYPKSGAVDAKMADEQRLLEEAAARVIQQGWHLMGLRREAVARTRRLRGDRAARTIQVTAPRAEALAAHSHKPEGKRGA